MTRGIKDISNKIILFWKTFFLLQVNLRFFGCDLFLCYLLCQKYKAKKQNIVFGTKFVNIFIVCINNGLLFHHFFQKTQELTFWPQSLSNKKTNLRHFEPEEKEPNTGHIQATYDPSSSNPSQDI